MVVIRTTCPSHIGKAKIYPLKAETIPDINTKLGDFIYVIEDTHMPKMIIDPTGLLGDWMKETDAR
jgi:hypothetical protein